MSQTKRTTKATGSKTVRAPKKQATKATATKKKKTVSTTKKAATKRTSAKPKRAMQKKTRSTTKRSAATKQKRTGTAATQTNAEVPGADNNITPKVTRPEHAFWVTDGAVIHSLEQLAVVLEAMDRNVYKHHVNQDKHDFADWVEHALSEELCASALRKARTPARARTVVVTHLKQYYL